MKLEIKRLVGILIGLIIGLTFLIDARADGISLGISGTNITMSGNQANIIASEGDVIPFTLYVSTSSGVTSIITPWNYLDIKSNLVIQEVNALNNFTIINKDENGNDISQFGALTFNKIMNSNGIVNVATFKVKVNSFPTSGDLILNFGVGLGTSATVGDDPSAPNPDQATGVKLVISKRKNDDPSSGGPSTGTLDPDTEKVTITLETNGGIELSPITVKKGSTIPSINIPTKSGYTFAGWYVDKDLKNVFDITKAINSNMTLYAKWTKTSSSAAVVEPAQTDDGDAIDIGYGILIDKNEGQDADAANITPKKTDDAAVTDTTATIKFDAGVDSGKCVIYRSTSKDTGFTQLAIIDCNRNTTYVDKDLKPDTAYFYRIRLVGSNKVSDAISVKTLASGGGSDVEEEKKEEEKKGNIGPGGTGALTPVIIIIGLAGAFIGIKKYYSDNSFFSKI